MLIIQCARCPRESRYRNSVWRLRMQLPHLTRFQIFHLSATANVATGFAASEPRPYTLSKFRFENLRGPSSADFGPRESVVRFFAIDRLDAQLFWFVADSTLMCKNLLFRNGAQPERAAFWCFTYRL